MLCLKLRRPCAVCRKPQSSDHSCSFCTSMIFANPLRYLPFIYLLTILANNNLKELESLVNRELGNVNEWLKANKLSLNIKKSNFVIFRPRQKNMPFIPRIRIFDPVTNTYANLEMKEYVKYLGLMIDSNLPQNQHVYRN